MNSRILQNVRDWFESATMMGQPPKDPNDDHEENEDDESENEQENADIREPDE